MGGDIISAGPVPGRGIRSLCVSAESEPHLHELFAELSSIGLGDLDIEHDLNNREIDLLEECGVLVSPTAIPKQPLFSCQLDDVDRSSELPAGLIVNPTLEFQRFDLAIFRSWIQERNLSPHQATVWQTDVLTGIKWGYWLTEEQTDIVATLEPGAEATDLDPSLASKLFAASVLVDPAVYATSLDLQSVAANFERDGYVVVDDIIPPAQLRALQRYYHDYCDQGFMRFGDDQVALRFAQYDEPRASQLHRGLTTLMNRIAATRTEATNSYSAVYVEGAELEPHIDREACVYSFSLQLDYSPEAVDGISPWPLYISASKPEDTEPSKDKAIGLCNGSCLVYRGHDLTHYRLPLPKGHRSTSLFFHYVPVS